MRKLRRPLTTAVRSLPSIQTVDRYRYAVEVPQLGSWILTHSADGEIRGLKEWPADQRPPVAVVFFAFRIMVGIGFIMLGVILLSWWLRLRGRLFETDWFLRLCQWVAPLGFVAVLAGWTVTEVGRQPWTIYGLLRTAHSVTPSLTGADVMTSLIAYMGVYLIMFPAGIMVMARMVRAGPKEEPVTSAPEPKSPLHTLAEQD